MNQSVHFILKNSPLKYWFCFHPFLWRTHNNVLSSNFQSFFKIQLNISKCKSTLKFWYAKVCYDVKLECFLHYCAYFFRCWFKVSRVFTNWTQGINWTNIRRSEDVQNLFWTSYVRSIHVLCPRGMTYIAW